MIAVVDIWNFIKKKSYWFHSYTDICTNQLTYTHSFFLDKPYFLENPPPVLSVPKNALAVLNCTVQGYPSPQVWWTTNVTNLNTNRVKNTTTFDRQTGKTIVTALLEISNVAESDFGLFSCYAVEGNHTEVSHTILKISCKVFFFFFFFFFLGGGGIGWVRGIIVFLLVKISSESHAFL